MYCQQANTGGWFNIKTTSCQYRKSHCGDKAILRPSYFHNGISYTGKMSSLYWIKALVVMFPNMYIHYRLHSISENKYSHYNDVIMTTVASQITGLTFVYSTVYSDTDQRKHQSSASLAFVWGIHRDRWIPRTKGQLRGKCFFPFDDVIMSFPRIDIYQMSEYDDTAISEMEDMSAMGEVVASTWDAILFWPQINGQGFSCHRLTGYTIIQTANTM